MVGVTAVVGSGVVLVPAGFPVLAGVPGLAGFCGESVESAGVLARNPLGWARRRPVGLVRSRSLWSRRG
ncbi:hypothetical protein CQ020_14920 [Arthrobacter sp. MYb23]|nr:hypothetical protein CQ038_16075 [Arthrobacter sp. MYb51]PRB94512.1 hypothetical protein CQ020_14920 [Arthrobacter sp. MYb23]